jgi:hypothetical protein
MMVDGVMTWKIQWSSRFAVALGGFLIFVGIMMIGILVLSFFGFVDVGMLEGERFRMLFLWAFLAIGLLDLVAGVILRRR